MWLREIEQLRDGCRVAEWIEISLEFCPRLLRAKGTNEDSGWLWGRWS